jgi:membrane-associated phospholipid phosphatase
MRRLNLNEQSLRNRWSRGGPLARLGTGSLRTLANGLRVVLLRILIAAASCAALVGLSVWLIDRPVASWVHEHLGDSRFAWLRMSYEGYLLPIGPFSLMAGPAEALRPLTLTVLVLLALAAAAGWHPKKRGRIVLAISLSIQVALAMNKSAKSVFGRTWPESWRGDNPSWIRDGVFGFFPFHGGPNWGSFPSGHTTVITTAATLLWLVWPELRLLWAALVATVVTGLIGANYHFVSDVIGGVYLGLAVGLGGAGLMFALNDCSNLSIIRMPSPVEPNSPVLAEDPPAPGQA